MTLPTSTRGRPIALVGLTGAGKSAVARRLAERHGRRVADLDARIEAEAGTTIPALFVDRGEAAFRALERDLLARVVGEGVDVIACGGGAVLDPESHRLLRERCRVVWLEVSPAEAARRVAAEAPSRPLLAGASPGDALAGLLAARAARYAELAMARVPTDGRDPDQVADAVLRALGEPA
jgi:shikimate kinase